MKKLTLKNLTPHQVNIAGPVGSIGDYIEIPSHGIARAQEARVRGADDGTDPQADDFVLVGTVETGEWRGMRYDARIFVDRVVYGEVVGLPTPKDGVGYIVSLLVIQALRQSGGRTLDDLYTPGEAIRDSSGRVVACRGLTAHR